VIFDSDLSIASGDEAYVARLGERLDQLELGSCVGVTRRFRRIVDELRPPEGETPAGFRIEAATTRHHTVTFDLVRDISRVAGGRPRPTPLIFSVDSANPYEVAPMANLVGNLTCNPGIVYDLFLNDPKANVGGAFGTLDEVLQELARLLGPGCDMSVELHNPFEPDFERILDEVRHYESIVSPHQLVVKVPHTGPVNADNVGQLLDGDGRLDVRYDEGATADYVRGHNLALRLNEHGYRVNFTLMFEPHQTALALQARPAYVNAFLRHRLKATRTFRGLLAAYEESGDPAFVEQLRTYMIGADYLSAADADLDLLHVLRRAQTYLRNRRHDGEGADGLDSGRQALRWLATCNLPETRLILCSMEGEEAFPDVMAMLTEPEFVELHHRVLITTEPRYLARWASTPQVVAYQRRFMRAARAVNEAASRTTTGARPSAARQEAPV
jgi:hypothetical protein